jgi:Flp pilus assembly pilin Flp
VTNKSSQIKRHGERGALAVEYSLVLALIGVFVVTAATGTGLKVRDVFICTLNESQNDGDLLKNGTLGKGVYCEETESAAERNDNGPFPPNGGEAY